MIFSFDRVDDAEYAIQKEAQDEDQSCITELQPVECESECDEYMAYYVRLFSSANSSS